jgi:hypothetical protein
MDAPEPTGHGTTESTANQPDLSDLFAAEDSPMLGGVVLRAAAVGGLVILVVWLLRRRRN